MFRNGIIFSNYIIKKTGGVVTHAANKTIWKYLLCPKLQLINCIITAKNGSGKWKEEKVRNLSVGRVLKAKIGLRKL
jgi:hypothetical protein